MAAGDAPLTLDLDPNDNAVRAKYDINSPRRPKRPNGKGKGTTDKPQQSAASDDNVPSGLAAMLTRVERPEPRAEESRSEEEPRVRPLDTELTEPAGGTAPAPASSSCWSSILCCCAPSLPQQPGPATSRPEPRPAAPTHRAEPAPAAPASAASRPAPISTQRETSDPEDEQAAEMESKTPEGGRAKAAAPEPKPPEQGPDAGNNAAPEPRAGAANDDDEMTTVQILQAEEPPEPEEPSDSGSDPPGYLPENLTGHKRCLVLDLDETLVHSSFKAPGIGDPKPDFVVPVVIDGHTHNVYVLKRPFADEFLEETAKHWELVIFTASLSKYADPLLDMLDKKRLITSRLFREHCVLHNGNYVKDLTKLGRKLKHQVIIDNAPKSYLFQPKNAVPITSWFDDKTDTELRDCIPVLNTTLIDIPDVRQVLDANKRSFKWLCRQAEKDPNQFQPAPA